MGEKVSTDSDKINSKWLEIQSKKNDVYQYYEYIQFKRARFDCTKVEYNQQTGRIKRMEFKFNKKFE